MFDIGFSELMLVFFVGLVVLGPQRLPVAIRTVMGWVRTIRGLAANVQNELNQELKLQELQESIKKAEHLNLKSLSPDLAKTVEELKESAEKMKNDLEKQAADANKSIEEHIKDVREANAQTARDIPNQSDAAEKTAENPTALSPAEQAELAELDDELAHYIEQYHPAEDAPPVQPKQNS